jgi:hypothetical protein
MAKRVFIFLPLLFCTCKRAEPALFELLSPTRTGIDFSNALSESDSLNILNYVYYYNGGGTGIADFNNDGLEDIFFAGNETSCRLYLNKGHLTFEDVTADACLITTQWCTGVSIADVNNDGWMDIYVCTAGYPQPERRKNLLFINQGLQGGKEGGLAFVESAAAYGLADTSYSTQAAFFDYDLDGDLDLYVMNHANERETVNTPLPKKIEGEGASNDHLYRNDSPPGGGKGQFTDITKTAGILTEGYGLGVAITDVNGDGWQDIYITNDFIYNDLLYINEAGKQFSNQISQYIGHQTYNGMGCDFADYNNDSRPDLIVVDMLPETDSNQKIMAGAMTWDKSQLIQQAGYEPQYVRNTLQLSVDGLQYPSGGDKISTPNSPSTVSRLSTTVFAEIGQLAGVAATDWSWAPLFADFDNDGWKDLFVTNGYLRDITDKDFINYSNNLSMFKSAGVADQELLPKIRQLKGKRLPNRIFQNNRDLTFTPRFADWGMTQPSCSNGAAYADLDVDGDLDLVVNNINEAAFIYENNADKLLKNNYLSIRLEGNSGNKAGLGATISIVSGGQTQYLEQYLSRGFMSSVTGVLHLGLGEKDIIDTLEVRWSDGKRQRLLAVAANQTLTLKQAAANAIGQEKRLVPLALLEDVSEQFGISFKHPSPEFNDFKSQPLLLHSLSENGPPLAIGDINGDGLEDCFIGGAKGQAGRLFYQNHDGYFIGKDLLEGRDAEDTAALLFDANGDGSKDLYVVSGSNAWESGNPAYQDRLYRNDGQGNLRWAKNALPDLRTPGSCVATADFDTDGDLDLFIGGSAEPGRYPLPARSYLLQNDGGQFSDVTASLAPGLEHPGIVTAVLWADVNQDGSTDLVLAGEWMPITVYKNMSGRFIDATAEMGLAKSAGWWNTLVVSDLDHDGDVDFVAGNLGLNSKYKATEQHPLTIYAKDFDGNGRMDAITCRFVEGKEKPVHQRDELLAQINGLSKKYPRYAQYAVASVQKIFGEKALEKAYFRVCNTLQTTCFIQENGRFTAKALPALAQVAPINAMLCADVNGDQQIDLIMLGNSFSPNISTGRYDASKGLILLGDGRGNFEVMDAEQSGFWVEGVGKSLAAVTMATGKKRILAGVNGGVLRMFEVAEWAARPSEKIPDKL